MSAFPPLDASFKSCTEAVDDAWQDMCFVEAALLTHRQKSLWQRVHGMIFVQVGAALEFGVRDMLGRTIDEVNAQGVPWSDLRISLFCLAGEPHFRSIQDQDFIKGLGRRIDLLELVAGTSSGWLDPTVLPLDKKTIRPYHFEAVWRTFGFDGPNLPSPRHRLALTDLADTRNSVAHGELGPDLVGRSRRVDATMQLILQASDALTHLYSAAESYLTGQRYLR